MSEKFEGSITPQVEVKEDVNFERLLESINDFKVDSWEEIASIEDEVDALRADFPNLDLNTNEDVAAAFNKSLLKYYSDYYSYGRRLESLIRNENVIISEATREELAKIIEVRLSEKVDINASNTPFTDQYDYIAAIDKYDLSVDFSKLAEVFKQKIKAIDQKSDPFTLIKQVLVIENINDRLGLDLKEYITLESKDIENAILGLWDPNSNRPEHGMYDILDVVQFAKKYVYEGELPNKFQDLFQYMFDELQNRYHVATIIYRIITEKLGIQLSLDKYEADVAMKIQSGEGTEGYSIFWTDEEVQSAHKARGKVKPQR